MKRLPTVFISGYSQAPKGTKLSEHGQIVGVMLEVSRESHVIVNAECTFVTDLAKDYFRHLIVGFNLMDDIDEIIESVNHNFYIPTSNALGVALTVAHQRYADILVKEKEREEKEREEASERETTENQ